MTWEDWLNQSGVYEYSDGGEGAGTGGLFHESLRNSDGGISAGLFSGDNTPEQQMRSFYDTMQTPGSDGKLPWGTEGLQFGSTNGFFNQAPVTVDGQQFARVSEDPSTWFGKDLGLGHQTRTWLGENQGPQATYNDQYGWLMPQNQYQGLSRAAEIDGKMDSSFTNWAPTAIMAAITAGMGGLAAGGAGLVAGGQAAAGAGTASTLASKIPSLISSYANSAMNGGNPWGSLLTSGLGAGYSALGGTSALGSALSSASNSVPDSYWNMFADSGQTMNDAGGGMDDWFDYDNWASEFGGNDYSAFSNPYGLYEAPMDTGADNWATEFGGNQYTPPADSYLSSIAKALLGSKTGGSLMNGGLSGLMGDDPFGSSGLLGLGARLGPGMLALNYANNQTGVDTSNLQNVYSKLSGMGGANPYSNDILNAYDQRTGQARGDLMSGLEQRGMMGSSFGNMDLSNFDTSSQAQRGSLASGLYNADRSFGLQAANSQSATANNLLQAQLQQKAIQSALYGRAFDTLGRAVSPSPMIFGGR